MAHILYFKKKLIYIEGDHRFRHIQKNNYKLIALWTKKEFKELMKVGDIIYVKKLKNNIYELKQLPKVNGGIIVMDPFN